MVHLKPLLAATLFLLSQTSAIDVDTSTTDLVAATDTIAAATVAATAVAVTDDTSTGATTNIAAAANALTTSTSSLVAAAAAAAATDDTNTVISATTTAVAAAANALTTSTTSSVAAAAATAASAVTDDTTIGTSATTAIAANTVTTLTSSSLAAAAAAAADDTSTNTDTTNTALATTTTPPSATLSSTVSTDDNTSTDSSSIAPSSSSASSDDSSDEDTTSGSLYGTWSTKSNSVFTGPGFFDPVDELLIEPALPGISYSFTKDGYWEEAIYQVSPNPQNHSCPSAVLIYQHGKYEQLDNGTLILTPFEIDGRQLLSDPCEDGGVSVYSRYNQTEKFNKFAVYVDPYHGRWRLDLVKSTGAYMQPLYLAYRPAEMLPTITMNPTATGIQAQSSSAAAKVKRDELPKTIGLAQRVKRSLENRYKTNAVKKSGINYNFWWYTSTAMMVIGAVMVYTF